MATNNRIVKKIVLSIVGIFIIKDAYIDTELDNILIRNKINELYIVLVHNVVSLLYKVQIQGV